MRSLLSSGRVTPGGLVWIGVIFILIFDGALSDLGYLPPPIRLFVWLRQVIGQGALMARAAVTANPLGQPPGQGLMVEEIGQFDILHLSGLSKPARFWRWHSPARSLLVVTNESYVAYYGVPILLDQIGLTNASSDIWREPCGRRAYYTVRVLKRDCNYWLITTVKQYIVSAEELNQTQTRVCVRGKSRDSIPLIEKR